MSFINNPNQAGGASSADAVSYDNDISMLTADDVQEALDELDSEIDLLTVPNVFQNIAVSGQTTVVADDPSDTVTLVGVNLTITTNATTDTITITAGTMAAETAANYTTTAGLATVALSNDYNDLDNLPSIPTQYTDEMAQDTVATLIQNGTAGISWVYDDGSNTLTPTGDSYSGPYGNSQFPYVLQFNANTTTATAALVANTLIAVPMLISSKQTFTNIGMEVTTNVASTTVRLGIYSADDNGCPGTKVLDAGTIDSSTTGEKNITISQALHGKYWLVCISDGAPTMRSVSFSGSSATINNFTGGISFGSANLYTRISVASVGSYHTALPSSLSGTTWSGGTGNGVAIWLKV